MSYRQSITHSDYLDAPASSVWDLLTDWSGIVDWMPDGYIQSLEIEGQGVGVVRHLVTGRGVAISERLDTADKENGLICLSIIEPLPWNMLSYSARAQLNAVTERRSRLTWSGTFELAMAGNEAEQLAGLLKKSYIKMFEGIQKQLTGGHGNE